mmetsp:Transcript_27408/g.63188  ORF Transcript_27408/g.63188 Transcript_27408/m.63188 type:complete len:278 (-) Transcript_27408:82-915(-)
MATSLLHVHVCADACLLLGAFTLRNEHGGGMIHRTHTEMPVGEALPAGTAFGGKPARTTRAPCTAGTAASDATGSTRTAAAPSARNTPQSTRSTRSADCTSLGSPGTTSATWASLAARTLLAGSAPSTTLAPRARTTTLDLGVPELGPQGGSQGLELAGEGTLHLGHSGSELVNSASVLGAELPDVPRLFAIQALQSAVDETGPPLGSLSSLSGARPAATTTNLLLRLLAAEANARLSDVENVAGLATAQLDIGARFLGRRDRKNKGNRCQSRQACD